MNVRVTSPDELLERDDALADLHGALARARAGHGELAVVTGDPGAGKTALIREFVRHAAGPPLVLRGACDPLTVPRPLGPLIDAFGSVDRAVAGRLAAGMARVEAFSIALSLIDGTYGEGRPIVFVVEDVHWADEATLDVLTFLGRRVADLPALLIITFRDDEVGPQHPLRVRLGDLASAIRSRTQLRPLSRDAVARLAASSGIDPDSLHRATGGNPFFVTEALAAADAVLPDSVRDAVLARAARLGAGPRAVLDAAAVIPGRIEQWLLRAVVGGVDLGPALQECLDRGLLVPDPDDGIDAERGISFRHELARVAIRESIGAAQLRELHGRALAALSRPPHGAVEPARLAFHAAEADDPEAVLEHAPVAAAEAARIGAHHEAARHLEGALRFRYLLDPQRRVQLLLRLGDELSTIGRYESAIATLDEAAADAAAIGDVDGHGEAVIGMVSPFGTLGRIGEASDRVELASSLVAGRPASRASALIETSRVSLHMLARQFGPAEHHGSQAIALAREIDDARVLATALVQSGTALVMSGDDDGLTRIRDGIDLASRAGEDGIVAVGYAQIGSGFGELRRYDVAVPALEAGIAFASARELISSETYMTSWLARCQLEQGEWDHAAASASALVRRSRCVGVSRFVALVTLGWVRGRRGDPDVGALLDEALALARATRHIQRLWPAAVCRAEMAWLAGRLDDEMGLVAEAAALAADLDYRPACEELAFWQRVGGQSSTSPLESPLTPFGLSAIGQHEAAARRWAVLGCPYEEAMARFLGGGDTGVLAAHQIFDRLGALPMRERTAAALRDAGVVVPRGPSAATRDNPFALTAREMEVLTLIATGATNRDIAAGLHISAKTVDHHVSHVLAKLDVRSRAEAAVTAERLGLTR